MAERSFLGGGASSLFLGRRAGGSPARGGPREEEGSVKRVPPDLRMS